MASRPHQARPRDASLAPRVPAAAILSRPRGWVCCTPAINPPVLPRPSAATDEPVLPERPAIQPVPVRLRAVPAERVPRDTVASPAWGALPTPLTALIGRDAEVAAARVLLVEDGVRLLGLTGPGGVGKTRLALRIAEDVAAAFADGVVYVPLAPIGDPDLVLPAIAQALGLRERGTQSALEVI